MIILIGTRRCLRLSLILHTNLLEKPNIFREDAYLLCYFTCFLLSKKGICKYFDLHCKDKDVI